MVESRSPSFVQHMGFAWFAMVMGLCGLSLAWLRAEPHVGDLARWVSAVAGGLASLLFLALLLVTFWRVCRFPAAVLDDARHPVRHVFVATLPSSLVLMATVMTAHGVNRAWAQALWMLGSAGLVLVTVLVLQRWLRPQLPADSFWPVMTPALFIPVVGNVLPALAGVELDYPLWATAQYGIAALLWPVALALVWVRIGMVGMWPQRLLPTTFVMIAPPAVLALSGVQLGAPAVLVQMLWGVALLFTLVSMTVLRRCLAQPFDMPFWGMSFPLAASAALSLHLAPAQGWPQMMAMGWLGWVTLVIVALLLATLQGLWRGHLLYLDPAVGRA